MVEIEVWVAVDEYGSWVCGSVDDINDKIAEEFDPACAQRQIKIKLKVPMPKPLEVSIEIPEESDTVNVSI